MKAEVGIALAALGLFVGGCDSNLKSGRRLHLPQGSAEKGRAAFVALKCTECHSVVGVDLPKPTAVPEKVVVLGGDVARLRTIGDLLTSIIHPEYALSDKMDPRMPVVAGKSPMPVVNDVMTVAQLVDLVAFLQPRYTRLPPPTDFHYQF